MRTFDRYICALLVRTFVFTLLALVVLFIIIDWLTERQYDVIDLGVPLRVAGEYYLVYLPQILFSYGLAPVAALLSVLAVFSSFARRNELIAAHAAGVSMFRVTVYPAILALSLSIGLFVFHETIGLRATERAFEIRTQYFGDRYLGVREGRQPVSWANLAGGWTCHVTKFNSIALTGEEVFMIALRERTHEQIRAKRMFWNPAENVWMLEDGVWTIFYPERGMASQTRRVTLERAPIAESAEVLLAPMTPPELLGVKALRRLIADGHKRGVPVRRLQVDFHARFAQSAFPFVIIWLGIPIAARFRRGGRVAGVGWGVALGLFYLLCTNGCIALGYAGRLDPIPAAWLPNWVFLLTGLGLFSRTPT